MPRYWSLNAPASRDVDLSKWKIVIGGGPLPHGLAKLALARWRMDWLRIARQDSVPQTGERYRTRGVHSEGGAAVTSFKHLREKIKLEPEVSAQSLRTWIREEES